MNSRVLSFLIVRAALPWMSFLSSPGNLFPGFSSSSPRRLRPGDDGYCQRCAFEGHDRTNCPDSNHRNIVSGGPCPHPRRRGVAPEGAPTLGPGDSASQTGGDDYSLAGLLRRISRPTQANPGQQVSAADVIAQPGYGHLSQTEAQRLADLYNNALRQAAREDTERRLRELGINPNTVLDPVAPPQAPSAPAFTAVPQAPVAAPVAPGTTQIIPFPGPTPPGQPRLVHNVEIGHITPNIAATNLAVLHRATYDANAIQTQLTAAAAGTFRTLAYLAFRFNLTNVTHGWRLQIRVVQQATLPAAPTTVNAFTAIGGTLIDRDSTTANAHAGVSTITFPTPIDLSMPIHVVAIFAIASGTNATTSMGRIALECGANADP